jgi:O-antigen ligase
VQALLNRVPSAHFTIADILIWVLFLLWIIKVCLYREFKLVLLWPYSILALVVWSVLSLVPSWKPQGIQVDMAEGVKEMIQYIEYFIAGFIVFASCAGRDVAFRRMAIAFWIATSGVILIALYQYLNVPGTNLPLAGLLSPSDDPMGVRGLFGDRNVLGAYLALAVPFMWGAALCERNWLIRVWLGLTVCAALLVTLSGGAMLAILLAIFSISFAREQKVLVPLLLVIVFLAGFFVMPNLPRKNGTLLLDSVCLYKTTDKTKDWPWQTRYVEWQPALRAMAHSPILGVGAGNYQKHINLFYQDITKPGGGQYKAEDNALNGYAVLGVAAGVPALLALMWLVLDFRRRAWNAYSGFEYGMEKSVGLGVCGALTGFIIVMFFTNIFVRGVGPAFIILLALAAAAGRAASAPARKGEEAVEKK